MGKNPAFQFYPNDWLGDNRLQMASTVTKGVWIQFLCRMWWSDERGRIEGTREQLCILAGCTNDELTQFLTDNITLDFASVTEANKKVTIINRRMEREERARKSNASRQARYKENHNNASVTVPSPSPSTPTPTPKKKNEELPLGSASGNGHDPRVKELVLYWYAGCQHARKFKPPETWAKDGALVKTMLSGRVGTDGMEEVRYCLDSFLEKPPPGFGPQDNSKFSGKCTLQTVLMCMDQLLQRRARGERVHGRPKEKHVPDHHGTLAGSGGQTDRQPGVMPAPTERNGIA